LSIVDNAITSKEICPYKKNNKKITKENQEAKCIYHSLPPDLIKILNAWPSLPDNIKDAIISLIHIKVERQRAYVWSFSG
jgi:hypothetical protein